MVQLNRNRLNHADLPSEIDIWRSANLLVKQHGEDATFHAAMRADKLLDAGDLDGRGVWLRILWAIKKQLRGRGDGEALH